MKVLALCRLFTGYSDSLQNREWRPHGAPAIARILEGLHRGAGIDLHTVFAVKDFPLRDRFPGTERFELGEIGSVEIWPAPRTGMRRLDILAMELDHMRRAVSLCRRLRPEVVYATYGQISAAAAIARFKLAPVVLRMMGVFPHHRQFLERSLSIGKWQLRSPFAHVVCTQEGSGPEEVIPRLVGAGVPHSVLLNGVDRPEVAPDAVGRLRKQYGLGTRPVVLFVGRLEDYKGCFEFIDAAACYLADGKPDADFVLVGDGSCRKELEIRCAARELGGRVHLIGSVPGDMVATWLAAADIYVSMNHHGNLSNTNLEALTLGKCMIIPEKDIDANIDVSTARLLPADTVIRYDRSDPASSLTAVLGELLSDADRIAALGKAAGALSRRLLQSWNDRAAKEIDILRHASRTARL